MLKVKYIKIGVFLIVLMLVLFFLYCFFNDFLKNNPVIKWLLGASSVVGGYLIAQKKQKNKVISEIKNSNTKIKKNKEDLKNEIDKIEHNTYSSTDLNNDPIIQRSKNREN